MVRGPSLLMPSFCSMLPEIGTPKGEVEKEVH